MRGPRTDPCQTPIRRGDRVEVELIEMTELGDDKYYASQKITVK